MKRLEISKVFFLLAFVSFILVLSGFASAAESTCGTDPSQIFLNLYDPGNSHAEFYNQNNYNLNICYNDYFQGEYHSTSNVRQCNSSNTLTKLSALTNAHAGSSYSYDVCFGDLSCRVTNGNCNDGVGNTREELLFSLSSTTNAHLAFAGDYANNICCSSAQNPTICNYNGTCDSSIGENYINCPASDGGDCPHSCGNKECEPPFENNDSSSSDYCASDCGTLPNCGDGDCISPENYTNCNFDCDGPSPDGCPEETTLCSDGQCRENCTSLPIICNNNGTCDSSIGNGLAGESCECSDCNLKQDECQDGLGCSFAKKICVDLPPCEEGNKLCGDGICIPADDNCTIPATCNGNGICDSEESCECSDCLGKQDSCEDGLICMNVTGSEQCVNNGTITNIGSVHWSNGSITVGELQETNLSYVNDSVYLVAYTPGVADDTVVNFVIYENDSGNVKQNITSLEGITENVSDGKAFIEWPITDRDIVSGLPESDTPNKFEYYFVATLGTTVKTSKILEVKNQDSRLQNDPPVANINSPFDESVYFANETINFSSGSYDPDGRVNLSWSIEDSITNSEKNSSFFQHHYVSGGEKEIILTVTDNDGAVSTDTIHISIFEKGANVFAKINTPADGDTVFNYTVFYNGSKSWAADVTDVYAVNCLGGDCPANIGCHLGFSAACPINVTDPNNKKGNYASMFFNWTYGNDVFLLASQSGIGKITGNRTYSNIGSKIINLTVNISDKSSNVYNKFMIGEPSGCSANGLSLNIAGITYNTLTTVGGVCDRVSPICCPRIGDYACLPKDLSSGALKTCQVATCNGFFTAAGGATAAIRLCNHYNNITGDKQAQCNADCGRQAAGSQQQLDFIRNTYGLGTNYAINNIQCVWEDNKCNAHYTSTELNTGVAPPAEVSSGCIEIILGESECTSDNYQVVTWNSSAIDRTSVADAARCNNQRTETVLCGTPVIALPFFTLGNFVVAAILIILIYFIIIYSKKGKSVKAKVKKRK